MKKEKKILLSEVNQFITCVLCKGYLIDATTITECLHTFCKKCIVEYLEENTNCPICDTLLHQSHPLLFIAHDRTLQSIVYKLVANLERDEIDRQCKFYTQRQLEYPASLREKLDQTASQQLATATKNNSGSDGAAPQTSASSAVSSSATLSAVNSNPDDRRPDPHQSQNSLHSYHRSDEQIALSLEPLEGLNELKRKFIMCSCHSTITHIKKYVALKIFSNLEQYKELDIVCEDEILGKDHTLKFILVTKWKNKDRPLRLNFRPKLVF